MTDLIKINTEETISKSSDQSQSKPRYRTRKFLVIFSALLLLILAVVAGYFYWQSRKQETQNTLEQVGKLIILPLNEVPTIATVTDLELLKDKAFFAKAKVGDKVIIYTTEKQVILYRPKDNKIVEVASLNIGTDQGVKP